MEKDIVIETYNNSDNNNNNENVLLIKINPPNAIMITFYGNHIVLITIIMI